LRPSDGAGPSVRNMHCRWPMVSGARLVLSSSLAKEFFGAFQDHILWLGALLLLARLLG
jgi:hypothetical protein